MEAGACLLGEEGGAVVPSGGARSRSDRSNESRVKVRSAFCWRKLLRISGSAVFGRRSLGRKWVGVG